MTCKHENFAAAVAVNRITGEDSDVVRYYMADVSIKCAECGEPFRFVGMVAGYSPDGPHVSINAEEARLPIAPASTTMSAMDRIAQMTTGGTA